MSRMRSSSVPALALICAMALAMACTALAQNSPQDYVNAHNSARAAVGVGPVSWDSNVTAYAESYAKQRFGDCQLKHSGGPYGENLFWGSGRNYTAADAVNGWVSEKQYYDYNSNTCATGQVCGHYTQVVWRSSTAIGCARVRCNRGAIFIICNYNPPGNYVGQRPYENNDYDGPQPPYQQKILTNWGWIETRILTNCAMALAMACTALAQNSPQDYVNSHNSARAAVGVGPVSWDATVAAYAQNYANQRIADCQLVHSGGPYGENIFRGSGRDFTAADAVNSWVSEKQYYDYNSNTCAAGKVCGHYTQVVWRSSTAIGCARVRCNSGAIFIICNYNPPGNYIGQRPY